jgi:WD40 repeat protein
MAHARGLYGLALSPNGRLLATASHDQTLKLWDAQTGKLLRALEGHTEAAQALAFSPDSRRLASVGWDKTLRLWSVQGQLLQTTSGFVRPLYAVAWAPDGRLAVGSGTLRQAGTVALFRP